jgi:hypothetical protein
MKRALLYGSLAALTLIACFDSGLGTGGGTPGAGGFSPRYTVTYSATATGDGTIAELRYIDPDGVQVIVLDPILPFSLEFQMGSGDAVGMVATGDVTTGALQIRVETARTSGDTPGTDERDSCDSDGTFIICELSIPSRTL